MTYGLDLNVMHICCTMHKAVAGCSVKNEYDVAMLLACP